MAGKGTVVINIVGNADKLKHALGDADRELGGFAGKMDSAGKSMMGFGSKMTLGVTAPIVAGLGLATKAAAEDEAAQAKLAKTLENTTGATKATVAAVEEQITGMMKVSTFADDDLRPAFENLVRETRNVEEANKLMTTAMDLAAAKGVTVEEASMLLVKAHNGQTRGLAALGVETKNAEGKAASFADVMVDVNKVVGGAAADALDTSAGKAAQLKVKMGEMTEQIGSALVPILDKVIPLITALADKFANMSPTMQTTILVIAGVAAALGPLITLVGSLSVAMAFLAANPIVLIIAGIAALVAGLVWAYHHFEGFRNVVDGVFTFIKNHWPLLVGILLGPFGVAAAAIITNFDTIKQAFKGAANWVIDAWNRLEFKIGGQEVFGQRLPSVTIATPDVPRFHSGGVMPGAAGSQGLALLQAGERVLPVGASGGGGITVVVNGALDAPSVARQIHGILLEYQRRSGALGLT